MLHTTPTGSLSDRVNVPEGLHQTIALGEFTPLGKVGVFTLIDILPPSAGKHWSRPVVYVQHDTQLIDIARTRSANNDLALQATRKTTGPEDAHHGDNHCRNDSASEMTALPPTQSSVRTNNRQTADNRAHSW